MKFAPVPRYPFLAALYPVLALAAANTREGLELKDLLLPLCLSILVALVLWLSSRLLSRDRHVRGLVVLAGVVITLGYELIWRVVDRTLPGGPLVADAAVFVLAVAAVSVVLVGSRRGERDLASITRYLDVTLTILVLLPLGSLGWDALRARLVSEVEDPDHASGAVAEADGDRPDIYLLVMDAYASSRVMLDRYGFDNSAFERALVERGFVIPTASRPNYIATFLSLGSMLNGRYLDDISKRVGRDSGDRSPVYRLLEDNMVTRTLQDLGYHFVFAGSAYPPLHGNRNADTVLQGGIRTEFEVVWLRSTVTPALIRVWCALTRCGSAGGLPFVPDGPETHDWKFKTIAELDRGEKPLFVFAHFLVPHEPLVYNADCTHREPFWPTTLDSAGEAELLKGYPAQVTCVNHKLLELVDHLLSSDGDDPIILIQSDHGFGGFPLGRPPELHEVTSEQLQDRASLFAAYHLPPRGGEDVSDEVVYDSMTPVNLFPLLFRRYFGAQVPRLPDRVYWSSFDRPFDFQRIQ